MTNQDIVKRNIAFSPPDISEQEIAEVAQVLRSGWITTGTRVKLFERRLAAYLETGEAVDRLGETEAILEQDGRVVCLGSATAAEELNFRILGIGEGDEVIVPAYTYTATAAAAMHCGANVVFVDCVRDGNPANNSPEMDYDAMEAAINEKTKAVIAVDIGGIIADYERIFQAVENKRELFCPKGNTDLGQRIQKKMGRAAVLSDCAHGLGAMQRGKMAGRIADFTSFSFHAVKNLTTGEGGASAWRHIQGIDDNEIYRQYQMYSLHGQSKDAFVKTQAGAWEYDIVGPWYKCNMTDIMAAIGLKQLERYEGMLERRREIIKSYDEMCDELGVMHLKHYGDGYSSAGHLYLTRIPEITEGQRTEIIRALAQRGISTNVHYKPLPMMTAYQDMGWDIKDFPNAYDYYHNLITLPLYTRMENEDIEYVIREFRQIVKGYVAE